MQYQHTPLASIVADLSAIYQQHIQIASPELSDNCITATFTTDESLPDILSILAEIGGFEVQEQEEGFVLEKGMND